MTKFFLFWLLVLLAAGCSVLGTRIYLEPVEEQSNWSVFLGSDGMYSPHSRGFYTCDSTGFLAVRFNESANVVSWGPMLLPLIPQNLYGVHPTIYSATVILQTKGQGRAVDLMQYIHFAFNCDRNEMLPNITYTSRCASFTTYPPCCDTTTESNAHWLLRDCAEFHLSFNIHPDSIKTIFITVDEELSKRTGARFANLQLHREDHLYYMPLTFFVH